MKNIFTVVLSITVSIASAQWSNTDNNFYDTLHTPVSSALLTQKNPIIVTSYPDNGYFVIWEDDRNTATSKTDIYAQKYDKAGNRLWAADGVPVSNGPNRQHYTFSSNQDYRSRSFAATDSAGGFYICYSDDSVSNYVWERATVQHIRSNGTGVFASPGYFIAQSAVANLAFSSQLIADGNKGFFIAYRYTSGNDYIYVYDYKDENGTLKFYGGGRVNENALQTSAIAPCGTKTDVMYPGTTVTEYNIWSDGQGGCNVIMNMSGNTGAQGVMLAYNRVWRAKKDSKVKTFFRNTSGAACPRITEYVKGDVYLLYYIVRDYQSVACGGGGGTVYTYTNYRLLANGYQAIDLSYQVTTPGAYDFNYPKGVTISTTGNINVDVIAVTKRTYFNNVLSDFFVQGYAYSAEKFDSVPFQRASYNNPEIGFNPIAPASLNKLNFFRDTLLGYSNSYPDFSLAGGGSNAYAASLMSTVGDRMVRLQHLSVSRQTNDSFAIKYQTNTGGIPEKTGVAIGMENSTSFTGGISLDLPLLTVAKNGQGFFSIREYYRYMRVSPIESGVQLAWGAMGKPIGTGYYNGSPYRQEQAFAALDSTGSSGMLCWQDTRYIPGNNTSDDIYMRHVDKLNELNYLPPVKKVKPVINFYGATFANPTVLFGTTKHYSTVDAYSSAGSNPGTSPIMDILDNNNLGRVQSSIYQNTSALRKYNGDAYLDRNYSVLPENDASGKQIDMKLYFTKAEFNALKAAEVIIADPGSLAVVRQPSASATAPLTYAPVAGEELIPQKRWDSVDGGYYIRFIATGTGNFFIRKMITAVLCSAGGTTITSNISGATYQWLVNTGTEILNITNNANYSGATSATLTLTNIPSSFNGYRYFCLVNGTTFSGTIYLQIANSWIGAVNNLWETAGNWSCGKVPDADTDVIINSGTPTISSNTATCRSIKVIAGANVNVMAGFKLTVTH